MNWVQTAGYTLYEEAVRGMERYVDSMLIGLQAECVWLLEHPALYTLGPRTAPNHLLKKSVLPVYPTGRGGLATYHGPGQRVIYLMLNLKQRGMSVRAYVSTLEKWVAYSLNQLGLVTLCCPGRIGVWVRVEKDGALVEQKIAAVGVRISRGIAYHGCAVNVDVNLDHYEGIVPCGLEEYGATSCAALGLSITLQDLDTVLMETFALFFGSCALRKGNNFPKLI